MGHQIHSVASIAIDEEAIHNDSRDHLAETMPKKTWKGYVWDTWDLPQDQRWLLFKVDAFVLTFASVSLCFWALCCVQQCMTNPNTSSDTFSRTWIKQTSTTRSSAG